MKITLRTYRPFDINKLAHERYTATLFGNPVSVSRVEEDGTPIVEHEVDVFRSHLLPVKTLDEASAYVESNFGDLLAELTSEEIIQEKLKAKEEAERYLQSTDYRTLKAIRELPEVQAKLEELYPGELERNRQAAAAAAAI